MRKVNEHSKQWWTNVNWPWCWDWRREWSFWGKWFSWYRLRRFCGLFGGVGLWSRRCLNRRGQVCQLLPLLDTLPKGIRCRLTRWVRSWIWLFLVDLNSLFPSKAFACNIFRLAFLQAKDSCLFLTYIFTLRKIFSIQYYLRFLNCLLSNLLSWYFAVIQKILTFQGKVSH